MSHQESDGAGIHESHTDFVQFFEIDTQFLIGLRSCPTGDGEGIGLLGSLDFLSFDPFDLEAFWGKSLTDIPASQFGVSFHGDEGCHA